MSNGNPKGAWMAILFPIGLLALAFSAFTFMLLAGFQALVKTCQGKFISAGIWLCVGIFMVYVLNVWFNEAEWADFKPLYIFVIVLAVSATILKYILRWKRPEPVERGSDF